MLVKNVVGSSELEPPYGYSSWLDYWEKYKGRKAVVCKIANEPCFNTKIVGAHVQKVDSQDRRYYIVPLCYSCNKRDDIFNIDEETLVPAP